jgi:hypothetical protein
MTCFAVARQVEAGDDRRNDTVNLPAVLSASELFAEGFGIYRDM